MKDKPFIGERKILHKCYAYVQPNKPEIFKRVSGSKDEAEVLEQHPALAGLHKVLDDLSKNVDKELRDITEKLAVSFD